MYSFYEIVEIWEVDFFLRVVVGMLIFEKIEIFAGGGGRAMDGEFYFFKLRVELFLGGG